MASRSQEQAMVGVNQLCGFWAPPSGLARLRQGQVLDEDSVTGVKTSVAETGPYVVLVQKSASQQIFYCYEPRTGVLAAIDRIEYFSTSTKRTRLRLQSR